MHASLRLALLSTLCALSACSVLVDPDESQLSARADSATDTATDQPPPDDGVTLDVPAPHDVADAGDVVSPTDAPRDVPPTDGATDAPPTDAPATRCPGGCNDGIACTVDSCDEAAGRCVAHPDSTLCGDRGVCDPARMGCVTVDCTTDAQCQNATVCDGRETCVANRCTAGTPIVCDDGVACTTDACNPATGACANTPVNARCDDGRFCNGAEICAGALGCVRGVAVNCDDGIPCTQDACSDSTRMCAHVANAAACPTRGPCVTAACSVTVGCTYNAIARFCEGFCAAGGTCDVASGSCTGGAPRDCADTNPCTADTCDPAAMMCRNTAVDADRDGAAARTVAGATCAGGTDCDDGNPAINPGAAEVCDGVDNNCNGMIDEGLTCTVAGDICARPIAIELAGRTSVSLMGSTAGAAPDLTDPCGGRTADVFYSISFPATANVTLEAVGVDAGVNPVLSLRSGCGTAPYVCNDDASVATGTTARVWVRPSGTAGTVSAIVMVKMVDRAGAFRLNVTLSEPGTSPAVCASTAFFDVTVGGSMYGSFGGGASQHRGALCTGSAGNATAEDVVVFNGRARVTTTLNTASPTLYTRTGRCTGTGSTELRCGQGSSTTTVTTDFPGGSGWIFADAGTMANRAYELVVYPQ